MKELFTVAEEKRILKEYPGMLAQMNRYQPRTRSDVIDVLASYARENEVDPEKIIDDVEMIWAIYQWRKHRVIYQIDETMLKMFIQQAKDTNDTEQLPCDLLQHMPYACVAIEVEPLIFKVGEEQLLLSGNFLLMHEEDNEFYEWEHTLFGMWQHLDGHCSGSYMPIDDGMTIQKAVEAVTKDIIQQVPDATITQDIANIQIVPFLLVIQILLYLQAENADIKSAPVQRKAKKKRKSSVKTSSVRRVPAPKIVYVGYRTGRQLRNADSHVHRSIEGTGTLKRPHGRRGHWHHFWTGKKGSDERKLVLKWVSPMIIHGETENSTTRVVQIKKEE